MATLTIGGRKVTVDDKFLSLPSEEQQRTVDEIASSLGITPETAAAPAEAAPPLDPSFQPNTLGTAPSLLTRKAMQEPRWPAGEGAAVAPFPISDIPAEGLGMDQSPPATAFPQPQGRFPLPPGAPPVQPDFPLTDAPTAGLMPDPTVPGVDPSRQGKLALQALGNAAINVPGILADVPALAAKGIETGAYKLADIFSGGRIQRPDEMPDRALPTEALRSGASWLADKAGYEAVDPSTPGEKAFSNIVQYGAEGLGSAAALSRGAGARALALQQPGALPLRGDKFVRPYFDRPLQTIAGDTAAGGAAGAALTVPQEFIPENVRQMGGGTVGALSDIFAMLAGGVSGGTLANTAFGAPGQLKTLATKSRPDVTLPVDPFTQAGVANMDADAAARYLQSQTVDPRATAQQIGDQAAFFRGEGLPLPATDLLVDDPGLRGVGRSQRVQQGTAPIFADPNAPPDVKAQYGFGSRDEALRQAATENVESVRPQGADPNVFPQRAADVSEMRLEQAQRQVDQPTGQARGVQQAREVPAAELQAQRGRTAGASRNIHERVETTRDAELERSGALYTDPAWTDSQIPANPLVERAANARQNATPLSPVHPTVEPFLQRIEAMQEATGGTGRPVIAQGWELDSLRADLESEIKKSLGNSSVFRQLKYLKDGVSDIIRQLPANHPGAAAIQAADRNWLERIAPNFREAAGQRLDRSIKSAPGQVYPEETGGKFLNRGEDASQLMRIAGLQGNQAEVAANARTIIMDQLASAGVIKNDVIDPVKLAAWRQDRGDIISRIPGLGRQLNLMEREARQGAGQAAQLETQIGAAKVGQRQTTKDVERGPLGMAAGKDPQKAIGSILASDNPAANMAALKKDMGNNPAALKSLQAAMADHFLGKVQSSVTDEVKLATLANEFKKNRAVLAEVFDPDQMNSLQRAQTVLTPLTKRNLQATAGSVTAESSSEAAMRPLELALKGYYGILKGGGVFRTVKIALKTLAGDNTMAVNRLVARAMFDPELAQALLTREIKEAGTPAWNANLQKVLRRVTAARGLVENEDEEETPKAAVGGR